MAPNRRSKSSELLFSDSRRGYSKRDPNLLMGDVGGNPEACFKGYQTFCESSAGQRRCDSFISLHAAAALIEHHAF